MKASDMQWISTKEQLPEAKMKNILFVIHTPAWHDLTDDFPEDERDFPEEWEVVSGWFEVYTQKIGFGPKRYWCWVDSELGECCISNEYEEEMCGCKSFITHWMPFPKPPTGDETK